MPGTFVPAVRTALVEIIGSLFSNEAINTLWVQFGTTVTEVLLEELADQVKAFMVGGPMAFASSHYSLNAVRATDQTTQTSPSILKVYTPTTGGVSETTGLPGNAALAIKFATAKRGRSFRGRNFMAGVAANNLISGDANEVSNTAVGNLVTQWADLPVQLATLSSPGVHVVASHISAGVPRGTAVLTPVTAYEINNQMDSMRRRLAFRGA